MFSDTNLGILAFAKSSRRERGRGQIKTLPDENLGQIYASPYETSHTYEMYSPRGNLGVVFNAVVRMKSVAIDEVTRADLSEIYLSYASAALVELYCVARKKPFPSLNGICLWMKREPVLPNIDKLSLKEEDSKKEDFKKEDFKKEDFKKEDFKKEDSKKEDFKEGT